LRCALLPSLLFLFLSLSLLAFSLRDALDVLDVFEEPHPQLPGQRREREVHGERKV